MSANALDLPVLASAEQIRRREFATVRRGYDPDQVREYLARLADQVEHSEALIRTARLEAEAAARAASEPRADPYRELAARVADVLRGADDAAARTIREAKEEAERILREARADADRIRADAEARADETRAQANRALQDAREHAEGTIAGLSTKREELVGQLAQMQQRLLGVARDLESAIETGEHAGSDDRAVAPSPSDRADRAATREPRTQTPEPRSEAREPRPIVLGEAGALDRAFEPAHDEDEAETALLDPEFSGLWEGTETIELDVPDIPPLDLSWGDVDEGSEED